jgi:hypothetical protein
MNLVMLGMLFVLTLYLQTVQHWSALAAGTGAFMASLHRAAVVSTAIWLAAAGSLITCRITGGG